MLRTSSAPNACVGSTLPKPDSASPNDVPQGSRRATSTNESNPPSNSILLFDTRRNSLLSPTSAPSSVTPLAEAITAIRLGVITRPDDTISAATQPNEVATQFSSDDAECSEPTFSIEEGTQYSADDAPDTSVFRDGDRMKPPPVNGTWEKVRSTANWLTNYLVREVGWNNFTNPQTLGQTFNLDQHSALGLNLSANFIAPNDPAVNTPLRKAATAHLREISDDRETLWARIKGLLELGEGTNGTLPVGQFGYLNGGFVGALGLAYTFEFPLILGWRQTPLDILRNLTINMPFSAEAARKMAAGSKFTISGKGKLKAFGSIGAAFGYDLGPCTAGVGLSLSGDFEAIREYMVEVTSLNGNNKIRVVIHDLDQEKTGLVARIQAGFIFTPDKPGLNIPAFGQGLLLNITNNLGYHNLQQLITNFTSLTAYAGINATRRDTEVCAYEFDFDKDPRSEHAFADLMRLYVKPAQALAQENNGSVTVAYARDHESEFEANAGVSLFGVKLAIASAAIAFRSGEAQSTDGHKLKYEGEDFKKRFISIFTGNRQVLWDNFEFTRNGVQSERINHFVFDHFNRITNPDDVQRFFRFARAMRTKTDKPVRDELVDIPDVKKVFKSTHESNTGIEVFFTEEAMKTLKKMDFEQAKSSYLKHCIEFDLSNEALEVSPEELQSSPRSRKEIDAIIEGCFPFLAKDDVNGPVAKAKRIMLEYRRHLRDVRAITRFFQFGTNNPVNGWQAHYRLVTRGRKLKDDLKLIEAAEEFATAVTELQDGSNPLAASKFFTRLGKRNGFRYMTVIASLKELCGHENVLAHNLFMKGAGALYEGIDQGVIRHPRDEILEAAGAL